ncbi:MAG: DUF4097 domain-containing protein [Treponema sp.]|jgi:hypothetical protein|nr:DUF4097 domain-containing protein [Treponema sp.]
MRVNKSFCFAAVLVLALAGAYAWEEPRLVHTETLNLVGIEDLAISYGQDEVILKESESGDLVIKEYMTRDNPRYYVQVSRSGGTARVKRGKRPWLRWNWNARAEIYLPRSFRGNLRISNSSGSLSGEAELLGYRTVDISVGSGTVFLNGISGETVSVHVSSGELNVKNIRGNSFVSVSSGRLRIDGISGEEHHVKASSGRLRIGALEGRGLITVSSGDIAIDRVQGTIEADISSGSLDLTDFSGQGAFEISSGNLRMDINELRGDLRFKLSSGTIDVLVPAALPFNLDAVTRSGNVRVNEAGEQVLKVSGNSTVLRPLGPSPQRTIFVRTSSGNLTIERR